MFGYLWGNPYYVYYNNTVLDHQNADRRVFSWPPMWCDSNGDGLPVKCRNVKIIKISKYKDLNTRQ